MRKHSQIGLKGDHKNGRYWVGMKQKHEKERREST